jgi:N-acyl-D-amino-acid deacylase
LRSAAPRSTTIFPAGGTRFLQGATGYRATIVAGVPVRENDAPTGARPGRLVKGAQSA